MITAEADITGDRYQAELDRLYRSLAEMQLSSAADDLHGIEAMAQMTIDEVPPWFAQRYQQQLDAAQRAWDGDEE